MYFCVYFVKITIMKKNIALVCGGYSSEDVISLKSADVVEKYISKEEYNTYKIIIEPNRWYYKTANGNIIDIDKNDFSIVVEGKKILFDLAFIIIHGTPGEDGILQGYFDLLNIKYTSCDACSSAITFNKYYCNSILANNGIRVSSSMRIIKVLAYSIDEIAAKIGFPCFVKPNAGGSSIGMSKVNRVEDLQEAIDIAFKEDTEILIEKYVKGEELSCGLMRLENEIRVFPLTKIVPENDFFDYEAKYLGKSQEITPAPVSDKITKEIADISTKVYNILNCFGVVRCDFIVSGDTQEVYFIEINTVPGQSEMSIVPQQVRYMGWSMEEFYSKIIELSLMAV